MSERLPSERLSDVLRSMPAAAVAVSGGIDSLTLATAAHRATRAVMHHATSPAVPPEATARTRALAAQQGWTLEVFDAGEFADPAYRANPSNRCFFCKMNLYGAIADRTDTLILSGTNVDDLGDWRPGLQAAAAHRVRHPFVEAGIDKQGVRSLARSLGLGALAELPASPCLSSRVETGIAIDPVTLAMVHRTEQLVAGRLDPRTVRCRVRAGGIVVELDPDALERLAAQQGAADLRRELEQIGAHNVAFAPYRMGSAFVR